METPESKNEEDNIPEVSTPKPARVLKVHYPAEGINVLEHPEAFKLIREAQAASPRWMMIKWSVAGLIAGTFGAVTFFTFMKDILEVKDQNLQEREKEVSILDKRNQEMKTSLESREVKISSLAAENKAFETMLNERSLELQQTKEIANELTKNLQKASEELEKFRELPPSVQGREELEEKIKGFQEKFDSLNKELDVQRKRELEFERKSTEFVEQGSPRTDGFVFAGYIQFGSESVISPTLMGFKDSQNSVAIPKSRFFSPKQNSSLERINVVERMALSDFAVGSKLVIIESIGVSLRGLPPRNDDEYFNASPLLEKIAEGKFVEVTENPIVYALREKDKCSIWVGVRKL